MSASLAVPPAMQPRSPARFKAAATGQSTTTTQKSSRTRQRSDNGGEKHSATGTTARMVSEASLEDDIRRMTENFEDEGVSLAVTAWGAKLRIEAFSDSTAAPSRLGAIHRASPPADHPETGCHHACACGLARWNDRQAVCRSVRLRPVCGPPRYQAGDARRSQRRDQPHD